MSVRPLLALALVASLSGLVACGREDAPVDDAPAATAPSAAAPSPAAERPPATRRVLPNCDPVKAARAAGPAVGRTARLRVLWENPPREDANLPVPVQVLEVREDPAGAAAPPLVVIDLGTNPEREQLLARWQESGHVRVVAGEIFLDPCSASLFLD